MNDEPLTSDEVVAALERALDSEYLRSAPQSRRFLAYVVTETLAGRGHRLSERTVGRRALGHAGDFDGRLDASVRVRATRVRKALEAYNATGVDSVEIRLPAGSYMPVFRRVTSHAVPHWDNDVAITADGTGRQIGLAEALSHEMARQLGAFPGLRVIGPVPEHSGGTRAVAEHLGIRFVLNVSIIEDPASLAVELTVLDAIVGGTVWKALERLATNDPLGFDVADWARSVAGQIGDYTGVILKRSGESTRPLEDEWRAMQSYYSLFVTGERDDVLTAADLLSQVASQGERSAVVLAALAHCLALRAGYGFSEDLEADKAAAQSFANEALAADPTSGTAHLALATEALLSGQWDSAVANATKAAQLEPNHPSILETAGTLTAYAGSWDQGITMIRQALHLNPNLPGYAHSLLAMDHLFAGDDALALAESALIAVPADVFGPYLRALALMGLGYRERAHDEMDAALKIDPTIFDDIANPLVSWVRLNPSQQQILTDRLRMFMSDD